MSIGEWEWRNTEEEERGRRAKKRWTLPPYETPSHPHSHPPRGEGEGIKGDSNDPRYSRYMYSLTYMMKFRKHLYFPTRFS